jgi:cytochrome c peroxidase
VLRGALCIGLVLACAACEEEPADPFVPLLEKHAGLSDPAPDTSNKYALDPAVAAFGKKLYFDPHFSGREVYADMLLRPMTSAGRAPVGMPIEVSCNSCHDVTRGGSDQTGDPPGNRVSFGGGAYDVNSQQTVNSAYNYLVYWNGRNDSLWGQILAVVESHVSVNGSRMRVAWRIIDQYKAEYQQLFPDYPLPAEMDSVAAQSARLEADGTCKLVDNACPPECHSTNGPCLPRFPFDARPGFVEFGEPAVCTWGVDDPLLQPYNDAWDCMQLADQLLATRIYVNFAKAIAAYEFTLLSRSAPFDKWADAGFPQTGPAALSPSAQRGAHLFVGKAACAECHAGPLFTDNKFHAIGVPQLGDYVPTTAECPAGGWCDCVSDDSGVPENCLPFGARDGLRKLRANRFRRDSTWSDDEECRRHFALHTDVNYAADHPTECDGRVAWYSVAMTDDLKGRWKTPGLRDVALTGPYMHDGVYKTLREVIVHYNDGGVHQLGGETIGVIDEKIKPLNLTEQEIDDLVAFLESLTGTIDPAVTAPPTVPPASAF